MSQKYTKPSAPLVTKNKSGAAATCPTPSSKRQQEQQQRDDMEEMLYGDYSDISETEDNPNDDYMGSNLNHSQQEKERKAREEAEHNAKECEMKWDVAEFLFSETIDLANDYVTENANGRLTLNNKGVITLAIADGTLELGYRTNDGDFQVLKEVTALDAKKKKNLSATLNTDIVKSAYLEGFKIHGWDERVILHMNTIPKFREEGFLGDSPTVNRVILPHEWKDTSKVIKVFDRPITNGMISFQTKYPGCSPENLERGIMKAANGHCLVNMNSPLIGMINRDQAAHIKGGEYLEATIPETNQVLVPKTLVKTYRDKTIRSMSHGISYGNVTNKKFQIAFEATVPSHLRAQHEEYVASKGKTGRQYLGFADPCKLSQLSLGAKLNENLKTKESIFRDNASRFITIEGKLILQYTSSTADAQKESD